MENVKKKWFKSILKADYRILSGTIVIGIVTAALGLIMAVFVQKLIDDILPTKNLNYLIWAIAIALVLLLSKAGTNLAQKYMGIIQAKNFNSRLINAYFKLLLLLPKSFFDRYKTGDLIARMNDSVAIQGTIAYIVNTLIINAITAIASGLLISYYSLVSGLLAFSCFFVFFFLSYSYRKTIAQRVMEVMQSSAEKESNYITTLHNIDLIKSQNKQKAFSDINSYTYGVFQHKSFLLGKTSLRIGFVLELTGTLFYMAILAHASYSAFNSMITIGELSAILAIAAGLLPVLATLGLSVVELQGAHIAFDRMYEFIALPPEFDSKKEASKVTIDHIDLIELKALKFSYVAHHEVLKGVNMEVKKGEMISIFGENGSGKSTILKLIVHFYSSSSGQILINEKPLDTFPITALRSKIAYVSQQSRLFNRSLIENICLETDETKIQEAITFLETIGFEKYIDKIPGGYYAEITENGNNLSGGQKQVIAFIRAIYLRTEVLLLDEPTAAMDLITEKYVLELMAQYKPHGIIILVTHRLRPAKISDRIYVLDQGIVTTTGNHEELVAHKNNLYADSYKTLTL